MPLSYSGQETKLSQKKNGSGFNQFQIKHSLKICKIVRHSLQPELESSPRRIFIFPAKD